MFNSSKRGQLKLIQMNISRKFREEEMIGHNSSNIRIPTESLEQLKYNLLVDNQFRNATIK